MHVTHRSLRAATIAVAALCVCTPVKGAQGAAQAPAPRPAQAPAARPPATPPQVVAFDVSDERSARLTRDEFNRLLDKLPPSLGRVLKLDPSLMQSADFLAAYPALAAYLGAHPEIVRNPAYYLADVEGEGDSRPVDPRTQAFNLWRNLFDGVAAFTVMVTIVGALMWLIRTLIDYRRWGRLTRLQQDVHTKLMDRFTTNEDLLTYMRTPAGERFLESAPISLDGDQRPMAAPMRRILIGIQAGTVLLFGGAGLQFVARQVPEEIAAPISSIGVLAVALGLGFIASAALSYILSRRLGLIGHSSGAAAAGSRPGA